MTIIFYICLDVETTYVCCPTSEVIYHQESRKCWLVIFCFWGGKLVHIRNGGRYQHFLTYSGQKKSLGITYQRNQWGRKDHFFIKFRILEFCCPEMPHVTKLTRMPLLWHKLVKNLFDCSTFVFSPSETWVHKLPFCDVDLKRCGAHKGRKLFWPRHRSTQAFDTLSSHIICRQEF